MFFCISGLGLRIPARTADLIDEPAEVLFFFSLMRLSSSLESSSQWDCMLLGVPPRTDIEVEILLLGSMTKHLQTAGFSFAHLEHPPLTNSCLSFTPLKASIFTLTRVLKWKCHP